MPILTDQPPLFRGDLTEAVRVIPNLADVNSRKAALRSVDWNFADEDTSFLAHDIHPYPAKFPPQIASALIRELSLPGDLVLDPFCGSGTALLEAVRMHRRAIGVDANPVAVLVSRVKATRMDTDAAGQLDKLALAVRSAAQSSRLSATVTAIVREARAPYIPNTDKWFSHVAAAEFSQIKAAIDRLESSAARDIARVAMSRIIVKYSNQDSETRYASKPKSIAPGQVLTGFVDALQDVSSSLRETAAELGYGKAEFHCHDAKHLTDVVPNSSVDFVVTSPPYGNAMDYHLYHRFRLYWLDEDPQKLASIEIGSHLRHQRNKSGFEEFEGEMTICMAEIARVLKPGKFCAFVIGDSVYSGRKYSGDKLIREAGRAAGLRHVDSLVRELPQNKRSFVHPGRRATSESIVILRKDEASEGLELCSPPYKLWPYEEILQQRERNALGLCSDVVSPAQIGTVKRLAFTHAARSGDRTEKTWQAVLENGSASTNSRRKEPKYATHGIHPYKGKFYPQLAKSIMNLAPVEPGMRFLDPFCGSGTAVLEGFLSGLLAKGIDMNPLAAKIARAKVEILQLDASLVAEACEELLDEVSTRPTIVENCWAQLPKSCERELTNWFAEPVLAKIDWLLDRIRVSSSGVLRDYFEVILSSFLRDVSMQDPTDLRIRKRSDPIEDADVLGLFQGKLEEQFARLRAFWKVRSYAPWGFRTCHVQEGDCRRWPAFQGSFIAENSIDVVVTSPPYATALPYIDTDRLSLLVLFELDSASRRPLENNLTGSREITTSQRRNLESIIEAESFNLPGDVKLFVHQLLMDISKSDGGFRKRNMPALIARYFNDMSESAAQLYRCLKSGANLSMVVGDSVTQIGTVTTRIETSRFLCSILEAAGFSLLERLNITVTTENYKHVANAIKENAILRFRKPG